MTSPKLQLSPTPPEAQPGMGAVVEFVRERDKQDNKRCVLAGKVIGCAQFVIQHREAGVPISDAMKEFCLDQIVTAVQEYLR